MVAELWSTKHQATSSILSYPEGRAAIAAARRGGRLSASSASRALADFESLHAELSLIGIDTALAREAGRLAEELSLRGYDSVHLATALAGGELITIVSWDHDLRHAAKLAGCAIAPAA